MFTGLVEEIGYINAVYHHGRMLNFTIAAPALLHDLNIGDSIAVNGACLTVTEIGDSSFSVQAVDETLKRTTLENLKKGNPVNLERALCLGDRLGGHLVQGHIDGTGRIVSRKGDSDNVIISIAPKNELERYIVEKGSVAIDGISLTVTYAKTGEFGVSVIPHTLKATTLGKARIGDHVNIETDIIGKYVEKLFLKDGSVREEKSGSGIDLEMLIRNGFGD